jgi:hypothetical protein
MRASIVAAALLLTYAAYGQNSDGKTAEQVYKNITVLKGIPADQLQPSMQFIAASLGVECSFCHVQGDMASDQKNAKKTARSMIEMTLAIDKNSFRGQTQVTCYSCHRGSERPVGIPPVQESDNPPSPAAARPPAQSTATADQILDKYVAAVGGAEAMHKVTSRVMKGSIHAMGGDAPIELYAKAPDKRISYSQMGGGHSVTAFDGTVGWMGNTGRAAREMSPEESAAAALDAAFYLPLQLKEMYPQLRRGRPEEVDGKMCDVLMGNAAGKPMVRLYFDRDSGLLVRMARYANTPMGRMPTQIDYADYREADGVKIPYRWTLARPNGRFTIQLSEVQSNVPIEDAKFSKPAGEVK